MEISQSLLEDLFKLLTVHSDGKDDHKAVQEMLAKLKAAKSDAELHQALSPILKKINKDFYTARDDTNKFNSVAPLMEILVVVAKIFIDELTGKLGNYISLAEELFQLCLKCSQLYSLAGTLGPNNYESCSTWLKTAGDFIEANGLNGTKSHAIWHNLVAGHKSRGDQLNLKKLFEVYPESSVWHFREAVGVYQKMGSKLENINDVHFRHVLTCLANAAANEALDKVLQQGAITTDIELTCTEIEFNMLDKLTDDILVLSDGSPDYYRRADCWRAKSKVALLLGDFIGAEIAIENAKNNMRASIATTGATGQLSYILIDAYHIRIAHGAFELQESQDLSIGEVEDMYGQMAKDELEKIEWHKFAQLGKYLWDRKQELSNFNSPRDPNTEKVNTFSSFSRQIYAPAFDSVKQAERQNIPVDQHAAAAQNMAAVADSAVGSEGIKDAPHAKKANKPLGHKFNKSCIQ